MTAPGEVLEKRELLRLQIADLNIVLRCELPSAVDGLPGNYLPFQKTSSSYITDSVLVDLELDYMPDFKEMKRIFGTGNSWRMFTNDRGEYFAVLEAPFRQGEILWVARFDRNCRAVTVYCGDALLSGEGKDGFRISNPFQYPLDQLFVMYALARTGGMLIHGAGAAFGEKGYVFAGRSGAGKSTLSKQLIASGSCTLLTDERVAVRKEDEAFTVFGTPWSGTAGIAENDRFPLRGIFFLVKGRDNSITRLQPGEAAERLLQLASIPWYDPAVMADVLCFCEDLITKVPSYELGFTLDGRVPSLLEEFAGNS